MKRKAMGGPVLLAIDAIRDGDMLKPGVNPAEVSMFDMDENKLVEGVEKLKGIIQREGVQLTIFGHDWRCWQDCRQSPEFYD